MSDISLSPYLFFTGNGLEAMEFYKSIFGGELNIMPQQDPSMTGLMHAHLKGDGISIMASDGTRKTPYESSFVSLSLNGSDIEKLTSIFNQLAEGGNVTAPIKQEAWGDMFGALTDKFGVDWMVNITAK